jgi:hypothetical protein
VDLYTLTNRNGLVAKITNFGGHVTELHVPDRNGQMADIVLGHSTLEPYLDQRPTPTSARSSAGTPTGSPRASSPSTASNTRSTPAAAATTCTRQDGVRSEGLEGRADPGQL